MTVTTKYGELPREDLTFVDATTENDKAVITAREWFYHGEMVRRDVWADMKSGEASEARKGN